MPQENVERLRRRLDGWDPIAEIEAWKQGRATVDVSILDPNVVYEDGVLPDQTRETGLEGVARATARWLEPFETVRVEFDRIVGDGDRLVSIHRAWMKARHTGIDLETPIAYLWTFRDGRVIHFKSYLDPGEALADAGLAE
jgi:ketosteroid isomerase-like protein